MNEDEREKAEVELNIALSAVLWDFSGKYFTKKADFLAAKEILISVLHRAVSQAELQIGFMLPFTTIQKEQLMNLICGD